MFPEPEHFVTVHRACAELTCDVGESSEESFYVRNACSCSAVFERWVTSDMAEHDLLRSGLPVSSNEPPMTDAAHRGPA